MYVEKKKRDSVWQVNVDGRAFQPDQIQQSWEGKIRCCVKTGSFTT